MKNKEELKNKVAAWHDMNTSYLKQIQSLVTNIEGAKKLQVISYFTYSLNITHDKEKENFSLGSFHIQNLGDLPLTNPYICIKVSPEAPFEFSGKYVYRNANQRMGMADAWERINDAMDKEEYWLKPANKQTLEPQETLSFSNFQVKWIPNSSYSGSIMGFIYGDELKDGLSSLNQLNISGGFGKENSGE